MFVVAGGEGGAALRESGELFGVECRCASFHVEGVRLGRDCVGEVEGDEASECFGEAGGCGSEGVGELCMVDADGRGVVGG